jgi:hypothetical protein
METEFCRIAERMDRLRLLDMRVRVAPKGAGILGTAAASSWSGRASLARVSAAVAHLASAGGARPPSHAYPWSIVLEVSDDAGHLGHIDPGGVFHYTAAPSVDLAMSWALATDVHHDLPAGADRPDWSSRLWIEFYDLPMTLSGPELARFYLQRWLPAWRAIRGRRRGREVPGRADDVARTAWRVAAKHILGTNLPDPSTFVRVAAS